MSTCSCKKVVAVGARTTVLMMEERCYGVLNAEVSDQTNYLGTWKRLELTSESVVNEIGTLNSNALNPFRGMLRRIQGTHNIQGDINVELTNNGYAWLITQAIGKLVGSGTSADPYTIVPVDTDGVAWNATAGYQQNSDKYISNEITYAAACSDCTGYESGSYVVDDYGLEPGFSLMISRDGGTIKNELGVDPVNHLWFLYKGVKVNTWSITATPGDIVTSTFGLLGRSEDDSYDVAIPSYVERPAANDPFTGFNGNLTIDDLFQCVKNFTLTVNNNLATDQFCMGERYRNSAPEQQKTIEGSITIEFTDTIFYRKFKDQTSSVLIVNFDLLDDGTETLKLILPKIEYNGTTPTAGGQEAINEEMPFVALWDRTPAESLLTKGVSNVAPSGFDIAVEIVTAGALV